MKPNTAGEALYPCDDWAIRETQFRPEWNLHNESIFAVGNGYIGMRGNFEEGLPGLADMTRTGTYLNGFYETAPIVYPEVAYGYARNSQTMLNVTDAKGILLDVDGERFSLTSGRVLHYERRLDMKEGALVREVTWESAAGKQVQVKSVRLASLDRTHLAAIRYEVTPLNFSGRIALTSVLDGDVSNLAAKNDPRVGSHGAGQALVTEQLAHEGDVGWIRQRVKNAGFQLFSAMSHELAGCGAQQALKSCSSGEKSLSVRWELTAVVGETAVLTKYAAYYTSKGHPAEKLAELAREELAAAGKASFAALLAKQRHYLERFWRRADVEIDGDPGLQQGIRFNIFQLLQSAGRDGRTNIGAKGLTGEGYEGHYFWDTEMYILPMFTFTNPEISRSLLEYRYLTLEQARQRAREMSQKGALYPWRTINGEETSAYHPAGTAQAHINADIAYGLKQYVLATGDEEFLLSKGAEIAFETARFWADLGYYNPARDGLFCIDMVTGPDEYTALVNNNAYTNLMARHNLYFAWETAEWMLKNHPKRYGELAHAIGLEEGELAEWHRAAERMFVPFSQELGIVAQDDTFLMKKKWDFEGTPKEKHPLLLHYHPLVIYRHQVLKQPDVVLALFLLGDQFSLADKVRNYRYYEPLTTHDSSLSPCIHSIVTAEIGNTGEAYGYFRRTARMDLDDINGNVKDGLHTAAMAGSWMSIVNGFAGMRMDGGALRFQPVLPGHWKGYRFCIAFRGRLIEVRVNSDEAVYTLSEGEPLELAHRNIRFTLASGEVRSFSLKKRLEAVIFDLDGVITDSAELHYQAWKELADELGLPFDRTVNERLKGVGRMESLDIILENAAFGADPAQKREWANRKNACYRKLISGITPEDLLPGIGALLAELKAAGIKLGLASASANAAAIVEQLGIGGLLDGAADPTAVRKGKPDPELFLQAAERLGADPACCIAIEDAAAGIEAIKAAGMLAVRVGSGGMLARAEADLTVGSTAGLNAALLLELFAEAAAGSPVAM